MLSKSTLVHNRLSNLKSRIGGLTPPSINAYEVEEEWINLIHENIHIVIAEKQKYLKVVNGLSHGRSLWGSFILTIDKASRCLKFLKN